MTQAQTQEAIEKAAKLAMPNSDLAAIEADVKALRRHFHANPELSFKEQKTSAYIAKYLRDLGLSPIHNEKNNSVVVDIKGSRPGKTIALRADIDALPVLEENELDFKSKNEGVMHACGHDTHTAMLLACARVFLENNDYAGTVRMLFQPAEEMPPGGAIDLVREGHLKGVDAVFGMHVWPNLATGNFAFHQGSMMAAADFIEITINGKGSHGSEPQKSNDAIVAACAVVTALQSVVSRNVAPLESAVLSIGAINGGFAHNIIAHEVELKGTIRTLTPEIRKLVQERSTLLAENTARAYGCEAVVKHIEGYPPLINDANMAQFMKNSAASIFPESTLHDLAQPVLGGEDFAYYTQEVPGAFAFIGVNSPHPLHTPKFMVDERALICGTLLFTKVVKDFLATNNK